MHLLHSIALRPNLELKTWPKQLLGSLPLDIVLPRQVTYRGFDWSHAKDPLVIVRLG
jgi:hypothetical protein